MSTTDAHLQTFLNSIECPVCLEYFCNKISLCSNGHSLCENCKVRCAYCPMCKTTFSNGRNITLEKLILSVTFVCQNKEYGCPKKGNALIMNEHILECEMGLFQCPLDEPNNCTWTGPLWKIKEHLLKKHANEITQYSFSNISTATGFICVSKSTFKICRRYLENLNEVQWAVQYIGAHNKANNYLFKLEYCNGTHELRIAADCIPACRYDDTFRGSKIAISKNTLKYYSGDSYKHKITIINKVIIT